MGGGPPYHARVNELWSQLAGRANVELTYYNKKTRDALISRRVAPSLAGVTSRFENIGSVKNAGVEYTLTARPIDRASFGLDLELNGSVNDNKLVSLGEGIPAIIGATRQQRTGYPLDGMWQRALTGYSDADGDGIRIERSYSPNIPFCAATATAAARESTPNFW